MGDNGEQSIEDDFQGFGLGAPMKGVQHSQQWRL